MISEKIYCPSQRIYTAPGKGDILLEEGEYIFVFGKMNAY